MPFQRDWLMRQIEMLVNFIAKLVFKKDTIKYEILDETNTTDTDRLYLRLKDLINKRELCKAEDLLFEHFEENNSEYFKLAVDFYQTLNGLSDDELEANDFSREEVDDGFKKILTLYGLPISSI